MSEPKAHNLAEIEDLLATRQQVMGWLEKLEETGSRAPEPVRAKVRADYRARLSQVLTQLSMHGDLIATRLEGLRAEAMEHRQQRAEEREVRAEAELRHGVGEYSDDEWHRVELDTSGKIRELDRELERLTEEIRRLEDVQGLIAAKPEPPEPVREPTSGLLDSEPVVMLEDSPTLTLVKDSEAELPTPRERPEAPRFTPRTGAPKTRESGPSRAIPFAPGPPPAASPQPGQDELAFIRSVALDPHSTRLTPQAMPGTVGEERPSQSQPTAKTLKCSECGSLNRPTEWYCERCGAELAAL